MSYNRFFTTTIMDHTTSDRWKATIKIGWYVLSVIVPVAFIIGNIRPDNWEATRHYIHYVAPIYAILMLLALSRLEEDRVRLSAIILDGAVVAASALRMFPVFFVPPYSGHALFLSFALITTRSLALRISIGAYIASIALFKEDVSVLSAAWGLGFAIAAAVAAIHIYITRPTQSSLAILS